MRTVTIDIINERVLGLLKGLEKLMLIRLRDEVDPLDSDVDWQSFKGAMGKQSIDSVDESLEQLRSDWS